MLDVEGAIDINAGIEQFEHVLIALRMPGARCVGVGQFIHQHQFRPADENGVDVHFGERDPAVID